MRIIRKGKLSQLTTMPRLFPVNCYLVEEDEEVTLIDAGLAISAKGIMDALDKEGSKPLTRIILTHAHGDHVGALDILKSAYPEATVFISSRDDRLLRGDVSLDIDEPQSPIRGDIPKKICTRADVLLEDGDLVGSLRVISTPGHTPGSISLIDTRSGALIAGDAFQVRGGVAVSGVMSLRFPFPALATWNREMALTSAKRLVDLKPALLAVGHGEMIDKPVDIMMKAIYKADKKLNGK
ncbi:glyoxylase-like metal-dependent hydrolase (beta-lactamase superfamily II) [Fontibacillus solani]|uniref:Glyoxylase-like metal-dependent hydrolase (Beta-lactamase superfamily II) n=1 Tax=Fontibacillus solani TaxID=1572857 RepID=A0A7W3SRF4_9BACL|nr:MBL fold metallo-hydrolase [Fontibacillus solani]MBA9084836.1 glyoxylase-like metal-dependent hydrolase (beta-lactamase superfamily II) [Fontibacillus solani]